MSTSAKTKSDLEAVFQSAPSDLEPTISLERRLSELREAGLIPVGPRGGGKNSPFFEAEHNSNVVFSLAAQRPSDCARVVRAFNRLPFRGSSREGARSLGHFLGPAFSEMQRDLAIPFSQGKRLRDEALTRIEEWEMSLCLNPLEAQISMVDKEGRITYFFAADPVPTPAVRRVTVVSGILWLAISKLLADTYINQNAIACIQFLDRTNPAKATARKKESAGHLRQEVPAPSSDQPLAKETDSALPGLSENACENAESQARSTGEAGQHSTREFDLTLTE